MNILKFFKRKEKEELSTAHKLRYPHKLFNGAILPREVVVESLGKKVKVVPQKIRINRRFQARQITEGHFIVCRIGKPIPNMGTFFASGFRYWVESVKLAP